MTNIPVPFARLALTTRTTTASTKARPRSPAAVPGAILSAGVTGSAQPVPGSGSSA
ncbi:MAG: hypothetical protein ABI884_02540 [Gemmatimonadota bacterium]